MSTIPDHPFASLPKETEPFDENIHSMEPGPQKSFKFPEERRFKHPDEDDEDASDHLKHKSGDKHHRCEECGNPTAVSPQNPKESLYRDDKTGKYLCHECAGGDRDKASDVSMHSAESPNIQVIFR